MKGAYVAGDENDPQHLSRGYVRMDRRRKYDGVRKGVDLPDPEEAEEILKEKGSFFEELRRRETGPDWKEVNIALQQVMSDYAGFVRSETLLQAGLTHLGRLKEEAASTMIARNPHELMRAPGSVQSD